MVSEQLLLDSNYIFNAFLDGKFYKNKDILTI